MTSIHHAHGLLLAKMFEVRLVASATWWQYTDGGDARGGHRAPLSHVCRLHGHCRFFVVLRGMLVMFGCFPMMVYWLFWHGRLVWMVVTVWRKDRTESVHKRSVWRYCWQTTGLCLGTKFQPLYICLVMEAICACAMLLKIYIGQSVLDLWIW